SRKHVREACDQALERMGLDYLDLYFCHRPDPRTPIEETVWAMNDLIRQGKVLYWGTSEWSAHEITEVFMVARQYCMIPPTMEQPQYNMLHRHRVEVEYERLYSEFGLGTTIWSPLASGLLTGKYNDGIPEGARLGLPQYAWLRDNLLGDDAQGKISKIRQLGAVAKDLGISLSGLALAWALKNPNVSTVITGASRTSQVESNMKALEAEDLLDQEVMQRIDDILGDV
ncbi:MAG: aldo/keto reductase, partial [Spirochaetaceae bacterium]